MRACVPQRHRLLASAFLMSRLARLLVLGQERRRLHDHAVDAVAALRGLLVDEGLLHRMRLLRRAEAFERHHLLPGVHRRQRRDAGAHRRAVDVDRASAALAEPAAEARAVKAEIVAQRIEQRHRRVVVGDRDTRLPFTVSDLVSHGRPLRAHQLPWIFVLSRTYLVRARFALTRARWPRSRSHLRVLQVWSNLWVSASLRRSRPKRNMWRALVSSRSAKRWRAYRSLPDGFFIVALLISPLTVPRAGLTNLRAVSGEEL